MDFLVVINLFGATIAAGVNMWAATHDDQRRRPLRWAITTLAGIYVFAYSWLLVFGPSPAWTMLVRSVGPVTWVTVWMLSPIVGVRTYRRDVRDMRSMAHE